MDIIRITDETTLEQIDHELSRLAIWRHENPQAEDRFNAVLEERHARTVADRDG